MVSFDEITEQKITEKYENLSQDLKDILSSIGTTTAIENIAAKYRLGEEKTTMLVQLVGLVILGFVGFENMKEEMKETIDISPQFIPLIADEIRQKIFSPVADSLQKVMNTQAAPSAPLTPAVSAPIPAPATPAPVTAPTPAKPVDEYREPTFSMPEIVDLRKTPAPAAPAAPIMPQPEQVVPLTPLAIPVPVKPITPPIPITPIAPAPAQTPPLIEAEPHKIPPSAPRPQYIMRPSGLPPTDKPNNVLDLRKDKGEF